MNHSHDKPTLPARCCIVLVRGYQVALSPLMAGHCRFHPTCSRYAIESYRIHGALRGTWLTLKRLLKCHPFSRRAGFDPVPPGSQPNETADERG
jgi:uncharacterized protein